MLPIPIISQLFNLLSLGSDKIAEFIESSVWANKGFTPNGLSSYFAFLESNIDFSKLEKFPIVEIENNKLNSDFFNDSFWRAHE